MQKFGTIQSQKGEKISKCSILNKHFCNKFCLFALDVEFAKYVNTTIRTGSIEIYFATFLKIEFRFHNSIYGPFLENFMRNNLRT